MGASPVYIPEKKLGKGGFGQVRGDTIACTLSFIRMPAYIPLWYLYLCLTRMVGLWRFYLSLTRHGLLLLLQVWLGRRMTQRKKDGVAVLEGAQATEVGCLLPLYWPQDYHCPWQFPAWPPVMAPTLRRPPHTHNPPHLRT